MVNGNCIAVPSKTLTVLFVSHGSLALLQNVQMAVFAI